MIGLGAIAWTSDSAWVRWMAYIGLGYMQMGMVTFMHDATHNVLFEPRWENWAFGIIAMTPLLARSEEHTSELQSLMRISYAVFCLKKKNKTNSTTQVYTK